eukprot:TRINITY_DN152_c0_g1_i6.p1 TRINITY_DN152_c0_g1~~TRINITY_DN152_c0_g1_i6.p1  ORF type:complete len:350 (-),score=144.36 TRINITY_DN152_c0_g1_i6:74-1123(-)
MKVFTLLFASFLLFSGSLILGLSANRKWVLDGFESQSAADKMQALWMKIMADGGQPATWWNALQLLELFTEDDTVTGTTFSDFMPDGRKKLIHSVGAIAQAKFVWTGHDYGYSGLFNHTVGSASIGFVRASSAVQPSAKGITPGLSFKFFRDNVPSANFMAMYQLDGQTTLNFFANPLCNHVPIRPDLPFSVKALGKKFATVSSWPGLVGLSDWSLYRQDGNRDPNLRFPFALVFQPNPALTAKFNSTTSFDIPSYFPNSFQGNEVLYKVYAVPSPDNSPLEFLGELRLASRFVASQFADRQLFFRHDFIERDFVYQPNWAQTFADPNVRRWEREGVLIYAPMLPPYSN